LFGEICAAQVQFTSLLSASITKKRKRGFAGDVSTSDGVTTNTSASQISKSFAKKIALME